jgi:hypothetical protein
VADQIATIHGDLLDRIREQNLGAYTAMPSRIDEDVTQESLISQDQRGRLTFELLQNADDAMDEAGFAERIRFRLTDDALEVANSGRALTQDDVAGLCGTGASSKTRTVGRRRASIGHKGMGFKSVLEITERPEVVSETIGFRLDAALSQPVINAAMIRIDVAAPRRVPTMRLPWPLDVEPSSWEQLRSAGFRVLFRFPLRASLTTEQRVLLARRLLDLPVTTILFLKHLDDVEVDVRTKAVSGHFRWHVSRERRNPEGWTQVPGFEETGVYRVRVRSVDGSDSDHTFLVAHDADVEIGEHRSGLDTATGDEVDLTEVSVAVPWPVGTRMPEGWAKFHVFLPTGEVSPYPMLVNGAFRTDISRQEIRVGDDEADYNRFLLGSAARTFRALLLPALLEEATPAEKVLGLLDRTRSSGSRAAGSAAATLHGAFRQALADVPIVPGEGGLLLPFSETVVPPATASPGIGPAFRDVLPIDASLDDRWFPAPAMCDAAAATVLTDFGVRSLGIAEAAGVLAAADPERSRLRPHADLGQKVLVDPVLDVLGRLWADSRGKDRTELERSVREQPLFPVGVTEDGTVQRVRSAAAQCFYPPRGLLGELPLRGLEFMLQQVCWGELTARERNDRLHDERAAWQALFGIRDFKFPDVMRASVFPALELEPPPEAAPLRVALQDIDRIAAICQLAGRTANAANPLPYERLGSNRALFNLARLRLPCRLRSNGVERWEPAYRVYFGSDWIEDDSIELVLESVRASGEDTPDVPMLAPPSTFLGRLARYRHLSRATADDDGDSAEVTEDEDDEAAFESTERERWVNFLTWLGVNRVLRPVSFHDVMDSGAGWLSTADLARPRGWAFNGLGGIWDEYAADVREHLGLDGGTATRYYYGLHDLDHIAPLLVASNQDASGTVARSLFGHLARGWPQLSAVSRVAVAISSDRLISKRTPPKPTDDEVRFAGDNFWLYRLRNAGWVPSTHGPRVPHRVWWPSAEIDRRFGRSGAAAGDLVPLLEIDEDVPVGRAETLAQHLGMRAELNPATFRETNARDLLTRLQARFGTAAAVGTLEERTLREIVRPAYRNLLELMAGPSGDDEDADVTGVDATLGDAPVLVHDGAGLYRFVPGRDALYMSRSGTRERLGQPRLETFILETSVTARRALRQLGIRTLENVLTWVANPGSDALDEQELNDFHAGLKDLAPFVLARLRADRGDDRTALREAARLRSLLGVIRPVERLAVECQLDGRTLLSSGTRDSHVGDDGKGGLVAYVRWGERGWPPDGTEANALATVLVDALGGGAFEAYLSLVMASDHEARYRLLRYAGAPTELNEFRDLLFGRMPAEQADMAISAGDALRTSTDEGTAWLTGTKASPSEGGVGTPGRVPLYRPDQLLIDGIPMPVPGKPPDGKDRDTAGEQGEARDAQGGWGKTATDLTELDAIGMWVTLNFERHRLRLAGHAQAEIFVPGAPAENAFIFDVSTPEAVDIAVQESTRFRAALTRLERRGLSRAYPGFDVLTLDPASVEDYDRLIELKSSGVDAQVQSMTWNEWKTARDSALRTRFYLYLVSNLRSDLGDRTPYLRAIKDPFGSLWQQEIIETGVRRTVQLNVSQFALAEELTLQVKSHPGAVST